MREKISPYALNESLGHLASQATRGVLKRINQELSRQGYPLSSEQFQVLSRLLAQDGQPQFLLAESLNKDRSGLTRLVTSLEASELVTRKASPRDGREKIVFLTEEGKRMTTRITLLVQNIIDVALQGIDEKEIAICKEVLRRFHRHL